MLNRRLIIGTVSIVLSIILFWIFSTDFLVFVGLVKVPPLPSQDVSASVREQQQIITAAPAVAAFKETFLEVQYKSSIHLSEQAVIAMKLTQINRIEHYNVKGGTEYLDHTDTEDILSLTDPIHLVMTSKAFDFATGEGDRVILSDTKLPFTLRWSPIAKHPGDWTLILNLKDVNQGRRNIRPADSVEVTVNGETRSYRGNDDIPFPIAVWTDLGVPEIVYEWMKLIGTVMAALLGATAFWQFLQAFITRNKKGKSNP
jgi:hypothetical protein